MKEDLSEQQIKEILDALDEMLETGPWDASNFLRVIGKNIATIRENFVTQTKGGQSSSKAEAHLANRIALRAGQQEIYVSLYAAEGNQIQSWEKIVGNLPRQMISRPIYADEQSVKASIKSKENPQNEAYVAIYVNQSDILNISEDKIPVDKLGNKLLTLKDKSLNLNNISRFVHKSGVYQFSGGRLQKSG